MKWVMCDTARSFNYDESGPPVVETGVDVSKKSSQSRPLARIARVARFVSKEVMYSDMSVLREYVTGGPTTCKYPDPSKVFRSAKLVPRGTPKHYFIANCFVTSTTALPRGRQHREEHDNAVFIVILTGVTFTDAAVSAAAVAVAAVIRQSLGSRHQLSSDGCQKCAPLLSSRASRSFHVLPAVHARRQACRNADLQAGTSLPDTGASRT